MLKGGRWGLGESDMDVSKEYIKMCACPEIQGYKKLKQGDWYAYRDFTAFVWCTFDIQEAGHFFIWLPRQDQLQEMVRGKICDCTDPFCLLIDFYRFVRGLPNPAPSYTDSMEQLWLAFVMHELHGKKWDGAKWMPKRTESHGDRRNV